MTDSKKTKKTLGRVLVLVATLGAFVGLTSLPATAIDWTIGVEVSDTTPPPCTTPNDDPYWSPDPIVNYSMGNSVDLFSPPGLVNFSVDLGFSPGWDNCNGVAIAPTGDVEASVSNLDAELSMSQLDCTAALGVCQAETLANSSNAVSGAIDASGVSTTGTKSGTLTVVWTPAG